VRGLALTLLCGAFVAGVACTVRESESHARPAAAGPDALARAITPERLRAHLVALAAIARRNGGSREVGTAGYRQSVAYVAEQLRAAGYRPQLQSFSFDLFQ
jgi:aminopeptidase S